MVLYRAGPERALADPALLRHEERHSSQYACLGVPFLPLYFVAAGWSLLRTGNPGSANLFERHAGLQAGGYPDPKSATPTARRGIRRAAYRHRNEAEHARQAQE